jgi:Arc/MetJ-type ribon-helix-helix transcriptional regulator
MSTTVEIPEEVAAQVRDLVTSGTDTDTAFLDAFRLLREQRQWERLRELVAEADTGLARGNSDLWSNELNQRLPEEARALYRSGAKPDPDVCP